METPRDMIGWYVQLAAAVTRMLAFAHERRWSELPELDAYCTTLVERLRRITPPQELSARERAHVAALTVRIEADQKELAALIRPELANLMRNMERLQRQRRLHSLYGGLEAGQ
jgi:flagellar protein FliT